MDSAEQLGSALRGLRRFQNLGPEAVAERAKISKNHLCQVERGKNPSIGVVAQICTGLALPDEMRREVLKLWMKEQGVEW